MYRNVEERAQLKIPFNEHDNECGLDRRSYEGKYDVVDGLPINPHGRTGLAGRGKLWYWGPNHAGDPVVTRYVIVVVNVNIKNTRKHSCRITSPWKSYVLPVSVATTRCH